MIFFSWKWDVRNYISFEQEVNHTKKETRPKASLEIVRHLMSLNEKIIQSYVLSNSSEAAHLSGGQIAMLVFMAFIFRVTVIV